MSEMENPYEYAGPLDPVKNNLVCAPREDEVRKVIDSIRKGKYWMILGSRQIGKTTFLRLIKKEYKHANYVYINFEVAPKEEKNFYQWLVEQFLKKIPNKKAKFNTITANDPDVSFYNFLTYFRPKAEERIILMFDEIDKLEFLSGFLHLWRKVYHERIENKELERYIVITTGSMNLLRVTRGPNSPFNIAKTLQLQDLSKEESEKEIIDRPLVHLNIKIEPEAKQMLWSQISGHPQLLQHACFIMLENVKNTKESLTPEDVNKAIKRLFRDNNISLNTLKEDLQENNKLRDIVADILKEKDILFHPYKYLALLGAGAFKEDKETFFCKIRNPVYKEFINDILKHPVEETAWSSKEEPKEEEKKQKAKEPISTIPTQSQAESPPGKPKKSPFRLRLKHVFYLVGITGITLFVVSVLEQNPGMMTAAGIVSALALGVLTVILKD
jgi:hypothetical protein